MQNRQASISTFDNMFWGDRKNRSLEPYSRADWRADR